MSDGWLWINGEWVANIPRPMRELSTCSTCGHDTYVDMPAEKVKTIDERFAFEREWDRRFKDGRANAR